jgi:hypothetical protein
MRVLSFVILGIILTACSSDTGSFELDSIMDQNRPYYFDPGEDYIEYSNNFIFLDQKQSKEKSFVVQTIERDKKDVVYRAKLVPNELYLMNKGLDPQEIEEALPTISDEMIIYFEFQEKHNQDILKKYHDEDYEAAVSYLAFGIANDFFLVSDQGDTLKSAYANYERNFHVAPFEKVIVGFKGLTQKTITSCYTTISYLLKGIMNFLLHQRVF